MLQLLSNENTMLREENRRFRDMQDRKALTSDEEQYRRNSELKVEVGLLIRRTLREHAGEYLLEKEQVVSHEAQQLAIMPRESSPHLAISQAYG